MKAKDLRDEHGMIMVELVIAFIPYMGLFLGIMQILLLEAGRLAVMHASTAAVRAAVVILDDDPRHYGGEPRNLAPPGSRRLAEIHRAAAAAMVGVVPPDRTATDFAQANRSLSSPDPAMPLPRLLAASPALSAVVKVSFPENPSGSFGVDDLVTVEVRVDLPCTVPLVRRVVCGSDDHARMVSRATLPNQGANISYAGS
jgi:hypothetical protein